jgi:hypothetical protein
MMWGCLTAAAITFPLVWGWIHFETMPGELDRYQAYLFGFPILSFAVRIVGGGDVWGVRGADGKGRKAVTR